jgi:photosystem II stability/assembly factor-like uncharacterized protein
MFPLYRPGTLPTLLILNVVLAAPLAGAIDYAPIMPLASRSLLLDITDAGERLVTVGERGHILWSDDQGERWQQARVPTTQMLTAVHFVDASRGWAVGHDGLVLVSDDGGETWRVQRDGIAAQQQANLSLRESAYRRVSELTLALKMAGDSVREDLALRLEDAQLDLEDADLALEEAVFTSPLMDLWFSDRQRGWAVGAFGTLLGTRDSGEHWQDLANVIDNPDEFHLNTIVGDGGERLFIAGEGGLMFRSLDGGDSWESLTTPYEGSWFGSLYSTEHQALLVYGLRGNLFRSTDFGQSWSPVGGNNNLTLSGGAVTSSGDIILVGSVGTVLTSRDGGLSFEHTMLPDRLGLMSVLGRDGRLLLVGQGGIKLSEVRPGND